MFLNIFQKQPLSPLNESYGIGKHISDKVGSEIISYEIVGFSFK
jgi:hypothetical protein